MRRLHHTLLCILFMLPVSACAQDGEAMLPFFIQAVSLMVAGIIIVALKETLANKAVLAASYLLTVLVISSSFLRGAYTYSAYLDNESRINTGIAIIPLAMLGVAYLLLRVFHKERA
jgi:hypothetical protein